MSQITITCPHCGFSKNVNKEKVPPGRKNIKCPKCLQAFALDQNATPAVEAASQPQQESQSPKLAPIQKAKEMNARSHKFCSACGTKVHINAEICPDCGVRVRARPNAISKVALLLITFFFGGLGGHKFYQKKYWLGALYLLFFWTYIPGVVSLVEFFIYVFKSEADLQEKYPETSSVAILFVIAIPVFIAIIGILAAIAIPQYAAYRDRAMSIVAKQDLMACGVEAEEYYLENQGYPTETGQFACQVSEKATLYYFSLGTEEYQLISYSMGGNSAYLKNSDSSEIAELSRIDIEDEILEKFQVSADAGEFHFLK